MSMSLPLPRVVFSADVSYGGIRRSTGMQTLHMNRHFRPLSCASEPTKITNSVKYDLLKNENEDENTQRQQFIWVLWGEVKNDFVLSVVGPFILRWLIEKALEGSYGEFILQLLKNPRNPKTTFSAAFGDYLPQLVCTAHQKLKVGGFEYTPRGYLGAIFFLSQFLCF
ncbi:hypothetical protein CCACVL1_09345 [Corchorus capsularis]|uniref:Uncharacterized protein n=1 Tax=Corchorus capsularis TaxID=210143 RepID=A0A1R3IWM3_COCAP|nr:hypothetical protein CCACVL1_09345 [Corchorus capsularis]